MRSAARNTVLGLTAALALAGCDQEDAKPAPAESDPALSRALGDQIMVDPGLAGERGAALAVDEGHITLPPLDRSPEAIAAATTKAADTFGGSLLPPPRPATGGAGALSEGAATAAQVARSSKLARTDCAAKVQYSATWAARLPAEFPVYPRGEVQEAAGIDGDGCALRVVNFLTPVAPDDVIRFYYTSARKRGYDAQYRLDGSDHVLGGRKDGKAYVAYVRQQQNGITEVNLVTSGR